MPSDIAKQIVQQVFGGDKAAAVDSINDALGASTYDAIQARKVEFAKAMGFELDDTAQDSADEIEKSIDGVGDAEVTDVDTSGIRLPSDPDLWRKTTSATHPKRYLHRIHSQRRLR